MAIKFEIWRVTFFLKFLPLRNLGMNFLFSGNNGNIEIQGTCINAKVLISRIKT